MVKVTHADGVVTIELPAEQAVQLSDKLGEIEPVPGVSKDQDIVWNVYDPLTDALDAAGIKHRGTILGFRRWSLGQTEQDYLEGRTHEG